MPAAIVFDLFHTLVASEDFRPRDFSCVGQISDLLDLDPQELAAFLVSCEIGALKPDPVTYATVLDGLGVEAADAVFVGNGGSDELAGARRAGFGRVVHCNVFDRTLGWVSADEQASRAAEADASVGTFDDLARELRWGVS